jgi:hypothetical protein
MKPSELTEGQMITINRGGVRIRFVREYTVLTTWVGETSDLRCEREIQITPGEGTDAEVDAQFDQIIVDNMDPHDGGLVGDIVIINSFVGDEWHYPNQ